MKKVFVATSSFAKEDNRPLALLRASGFEVRLNPHGRKLTEDETIGFISEVDFLIAGTEPLTRRVLESAKNLKIISRCGVGLENVDLEFAAKRGIKVYNTPEGPTVSVAELTIGLMLDLLRQITRMCGEVKTGTWAKKMGNLLKGKKIGIIGFGRIGQKVAELLLPLGTEVRYFDVSIIKTALPCRPMPLPGLLQWADIITLHCSASEKIGPIIGKEELKEIKKGAWLINTSRGGLVDENALHDSLKEGHLAGAALDVFESEPYIGPLKDLDNVILTPHIGSYARESRIEMEIQAVENLLNGLKARVQVKG